MAPRLGYERIPSNPSRYINHPALRRLSFLQIAVK